MLVPQLLLDTLEELNEHDFTKFKWFLALNVWNNLKQMTKCYLESPHRHDAVSRMIESYGEEMAVGVTAEILKRMNHNNTAEKLKKAYTEGAVAKENICHPQSSVLALPNHPTGLKIPAGDAITPKATTATSISVIVSGQVNGSIITAPIVNYHYHFNQN
ncbi:Pyrin Marenostrin [Collichthys lucidus]|uniref:Pyrin Marenostrin n=1 Tax=Collichthys lucidus TaxID=240159 RepID=A0A4U5U440_COLLU|nr:Pyrin Marenostrin [Collichthys lucidus]